MKVLLGQFTIAVGMFLVVNWVGGRSVRFGYQTLSLFADIDEAPLFNALYRIVAPNVLLVIVAAALHTAAQDSFLVDSYRIIVFYFLFRWVYIFVLGRKLLTRWRQQVVVGGLSMWLAWALHRYFIGSNQTLFPRVEDLSTELWLIVVLFVYHTLNQSLTARSSVNERYRKRYIAAQFAKFKDQYGTVIRGRAKSRFVEALVYAVLVYESYNRPPIYQWIERNVFSRFRKRLSYGPMQIPANEPITNREAVERGVERFNELASSSLAVFTPLDDDPELGAALRSGGLAELDRRIGEVPRHMLDQLVSQVAMWYNARSDYPNEITEVFSELVPIAFPEFEPG